MNPGLGVSTGCGVLIRQPRRFKVRDCTGIVKAVYSGEWTEMLAARNIKRTRNLRRN